MNELESLEGRLKIAIDRIELAISARGEGAGDSFEIAAENTQLKQDLSEFKELRKRDIQQLDGLMAKIRPLLEENNA